MSCNCTSTSSSSEGCNPLPAVTSAARVLARGADGCPVELTGSGIVVQDAGGVRVASGSSSSPVSLGAIQSATTLGGILGVKVSAIGPENSNLYKISGDGVNDTGKVIKWTGTEFALRSLLESICWDTDIIAETCCAQDGIAVFQQSGSSMCLQKWDPCNTDNGSNPDNPRFIACEDDKLISFTLDQLPAVASGESYQNLVVTADGPRVLGSSGSVSTKQFIPIDLVSGAAPLVMPNTNYSSGSTGSVLSGTIDFATATGVAIPSGATHIQLLFMFLFDKDQNGSQNWALYVPGLTSDSTLRGVAFMGPNEDQGTSMNVTLTAPLSPTGTVSWQIVRSGDESNYFASGQIRLEGYWVG